MTAVRTPIDPRIRERRDEVKRAGTRWQRRIVHGVVLVVLLTSLGVAMTRTPLLDVDHVRVEGTTRVQPDEVVEAAGVERGARMVELDLSTAAERVAGIPWVDRATIVRQWPGTVRIEITERVPVAFVADGSGRGVLVDARRRVLAPAAEEPLLLVRLAGVSAGGVAVGRHLPPSVQPALDVVGALPHSMIAAVDTASVEEGDEVVLELETGARVLLGRAEDVGEKLLALATMLEQVDLGGADVIDLRVPDAPVVTR